jgi:predicted ATPase
MFKQLTVRNFKSLADFKLDLGSFNCLIGMNGAGKSTALQAIDFISRLMIGRLDDWFKARDWVRHDIASKLRSARPVEVGLTFVASNGKRVVWTATFSGRGWACESEWIFVDPIGGPAALRIDKGRLGKNRDPLEPIEYEYQGSILSVLKDSALTQEIIQFRDAVRKIRSLELLAPDLMRRRGRAPGEDIGIGGEKLSSFLHGIKPTERARLLELLRGFYPHLVEIKTTSQQAGWKKLTVVEQFGDRKIETEARHLNDGLLRVLAILTQTGSDRTLVLLDEIENGINPELVERLVDALVSSQQQVLVTTHSPMILNYLDDDVALSAVQFVYKNAFGETRARPFFTIPRVGEKLALMGPGEVFVDTDLVALTAECAALDETDAAASVAGRGAASA